jgi:Terminase large subunit, T4likevirus-type, N-terminal
LQTLDRVATNKRTPLDNFRLRPDLILRAAGIKPDPWQVQVLESTAPRLALLCSRQVGKSTTSAAVAVLTALLEAPALVLVLSPSERQSGEFMNKVRAFYSALKRPRKLAGPINRLKDALNAQEALDAAWRAIPEPERQSALQLHLKNGSRIIGLPASPATIIGYSGVSLLVIDEAARVPDDLYRSVRPLLAVSRGRLLALSTPFGKRGWFYEGFEKGIGWDRFRVTAEQCPRILPEFLAEERLVLGPRWYKQEYMCSWEDAIDAVFDQATIDRMFNPNARPALILE